jgi:transposase-like protein
MAYRQPPGLRPTDPLPSILPGAFPFTTYRRLRFGERPSCPRCGDDRVHRWGSFSGRKRYRCVGCRRTFSDFTATPLAYIKKLSAWSPYCLCMRGGLPIRTAARLVGISSATAFRWRHRILPAQDFDTTSVMGRAVTVGETWFQQSEKGSRTLDRPPRRRRIWHRCDATPVWVLVARDERTRIATAVVGLRRPDPDDIIAALGHRLRPDAELMSRYGWYGAPARAADRLEIPHRDAGITAPQVVAVRFYSVRMRRWLQRFRGVATRYLANYLAWFRFVEGSAAWPERTTVAALSAGQPP